jgi:predicted nucleic acid-binding protein
MNAVDTNVLVYAVDTSEPDKSERALEVLGDLRASGEPLVVVWQIAAEFLACLRRWENSGRITRAQVEAYLTQFIEPLPIVLPTRDLLRRSLDLSRRYSLSHWDSLLIAACIDAGIRTLYSEDMQSGVTYESVTVVDPFAV